MAMLIFVVWPAMLRAQPISLPADIVPGDGFGADVALANPYLLVSTFGVNQPTSVYVYRKTAGEWRQEAQLFSPEGALSKRFGTHIALEGEVAVIGDPGFSQPLSGVGAVYIFVRSEAGTWEWAQTLQPPNSRIAYNFGQVAIKDGTIFVGSTGADGPSVRQGAVFVYAERQGTWTLTSTLTAPDGKFEDRFGAGLSVAPSWTVVGAPRHDLTQADAGATYLFALDPTNSNQWPEPAKLTRPVIGRKDEFGAKIASRDNLVLIGAPGASGNASKSGTAHLFNLESAASNEWRHSAMILAPDGESGDLFGAALALDGNRLVIGAPHHDGLNTDTGALYLFERSSADPDAWQLTTKLNAPTGQGNARFGNSIALEGNLLLVGALGDALGAGAAYVYDLSRPLENTHVTFKRIARRGNPIPNPSIEAILEDREGFLWLGTHDGIHRYDGYAFQSYYHNPSDERSLSSGIVLSILEDQQNRLWVGTENGLSRYDHLEDRFVRHTLPSDSTYPRQSIRAIFEDDAGAVWTGTNGRLYRFDSSADQFEHYLPFTGLPEQLDEGYISGIQQDAAGHLWVLTKNLWEHRAALYRIELEHDEVVRFPLAPEWGQVGPFLIDSEDRFWVKAPYPVAFPPDDKGILHPTAPPSTAVHWNFLEDRAGTIWTATLEGVLRNTLGASEVTTSGLEPKGAFNSALSLHQLRSGHMLVGTNNGIYHLEGTGSVPTPQSSLVLTKFQVSTLKGIRHHTFYGLDQIALTHRDYSFAFEYAVLSLTYPRQHQYRYRIAGYDKDWIDAGERRIATYSNVPPGRYTLEIEGAPLENEAQVTSLAVPLIVKPAFWQTWWFRGMAGLLILTLLVSLYRYRVNRLLELERIRLRIASDLHDDVSSNLSGIALMSQIVEQQPGLAPDQRHQLGRIADTAERTVEDLRNIVWLVDPGHDRLEDLILKMKDTTSMLLDGTQYSFDVSNDVDPGPLDMTFRREVLLIYKEVLHNIVRHAKASNVRIGIWQNAQQFVLRIQDDGLGFDPASISAGHGLGSMRRRAEAISAELEIESQPENGTQITLSVKMA